jgi:uncharacterized membrane protein
MAVLIAVLYPDPEVADGALESVDALIANGHIDVEDACAVVKNDEGQVFLHQERDLSVLGGVAGFVAGTFLGWLVLMPYLGLPAAVLGAATAKGWDRGINDQYMRDLSHEMEPNTSALFLLVRNTPLETILEALAPYGGRIFHTSLSPEQQAEIEKKFIGFESSKVPQQEFTQELY